MKQNRKTQVLLGAMVVLVWGIVVYRFLALKNGSNEAFHLAEGSLPSMAGMVETDTFALALDYPDPFLQVRKDEMVEDKPHKATKLRKVAFTKPQLPGLALRPEIYYRGFSKNADGISLVRISVSGRSATLAPGESIGGVRLLDIFQDSIRVYWNGQLLTIKR
jgi:hypothetical protein